MTISRSDMGLQGIIGMWADIIHLLRPTYQDGMYVGLLADRQGFQKII